MPKLEIEVKYRLTPKLKKSVEAYIKSERFKLDRETEEADTYYTRADVDFMQTKECLRIRRTHQYSELTYKPGTTKAMHRTRSFWKQETNIPITGNEDEMHALLKNLGHIELTTVTKKRLMYRRGDTVLALDRIAGLGDFLEIEVMGEAADKEKVLAHIHDIAKKLGLSSKQRVGLPYRDLLIAAKNS